MSDRNDRPTPKTHELRPVEDSDHQFLVDLHNDPEVLRNLTHPAPITMDQHVAWWKKISHDHRQLRLIYTVDDELVGFTKFINIDRANNNCVLGADIQKGHRGMGHAKHMWQLMLEKCFNNMGLYRVSLTTASFNTKGQHIYQKLGFLEEGRLIRSLYRDGHYYDQICMYLLREDWRVDV